MALTGELRGSRKVVYPMEEKNVQSGTELNEEQMEQTAGGTTGLEAIEALDLTGLFDEPIRATREAMAMMSESVRACIEMEQRKMGWSNEQ